MECRVGRAVRAYGHDLLPDSDRTVNVYLHIATLPKEMPSPSKNKLQDVFDEVSDGNIGTLVKEKIKEVIKKVGMKGIKELMQSVPEDGMNFEQLKALLAPKSKGGTEELTWPQETADQIMWKQVQSEREEMSAILNDFKSRAADFNILRSALARQ